MGAGSIASSCAGDAGARDVVPASPSRARRLAAPMVRSGTALEVAEISWLAEGVSRETRALDPVRHRLPQSRSSGRSSSSRLYRYRAGERLDARLPPDEAGPVDDAAGDARRHRRRSRSSTAAPTGRPRARLRRLSRAARAGRRSPTSPRSRARPAAPTPSSTGYRIAGVRRRRRRSRRDPLRLADPRRPRRRRPDARRRDRARGGRAPARRASSSRPAS